MSAVNTVNTVDQTIVAYANDNVSNTIANDYNNDVSKTLETALNPRKSLADIAGISLAFLRSTLTTTTNKE